jgi:dienelactone hydrolase
VWKHRKNRHDSTTDPSFDYEAWKQKHTAFADEAVPKWVDAVAARYKDGKTKFVCVGYCFGAPYVCNELAKNTVVAGAFAHPAFLKEHHFEQIQSMQHRLFSESCFLTNLYHRTTVPFLLGG